MEDLILIIEKLPALYYRSVFDKLDRNVASKQIQISNMQREGEHSQLRVKLRQSQVLYSADADMNDKQGDVHNQDD